MRSVVALAAALALAACGTEGGLPPPAVPAWARVSPEQIAAAKEAGVSVAAENSIGMRFVLIPAGRFRMGSPGTEEGRDGAEVQHEVTLTRPYYMGVTEVTNAQFRRFMPEHDGGVIDGLNWNGDDQPAGQVSWSEAMAFAVWLSELDPTRTYRLPTEAEWERACRAGTGTAFWWGNTVTTEQANYDGGQTLGGGTKGPFRNVTVPVGTLPANPWGLHEVHGNVWEWCADWQGDYPAGLLIDPTGPSSGVHRVLRGGACNRGPVNIRAATRHGRAPDDLFNTDGFRVAVSVPAK